MHDENEQSATGGRTGVGDRLGLIAGGSQDGIWDLDLESGEIFVSARWLELTGVDRAPTSFDEWIELVHPDDRSLVKEATLAHLSGNTGHLEVEVRLLGDDGYPQWILVRGLADGNDPPRRIAGSITDTSATHRTVHQLRHQAFHDPLTGLPNRTFLLEELNRHHARELRDRSDGIAVLFLDLVGFKGVNDHFGHDVGDEILRTIGRRLRVATRPEDLPTRLGGDEFVVVMADIDSTDAALQVAERLVRLIERPIAAGGIDHDLVASAGLVVTDDSSWTPESVIREADTAMYRAKRRGSDRIESSTVRRIEADTTAAPWRALETAAEEGRLLLHYQPMVSLDDRRVVGYESFLRWRRPGRGIVPAYSLATEIDPVLDAHLSSWALAHSVEEASTRGSGVPMLAVNVSRMHLVGARFVQDIEELLSKHDLDPAWLRLEVSAQSLDGIDLRSLDPLRRLGLGLHLDDFGAGDASIRLLHEARPDAVKLSGPLCEAALSDAGAQRMLRAVCAASEVEGIVATGTNIEVPATARVLQDSGCAIGQGNLYGVPGPPQMAFSDRPSETPSSVAAALLG